MRGSPAHAARPNTQPTAAQRSSKEGVKRGKKERNGAHTQGERKKKEKSIYLPPLKREREKKWRVVVAAAAAAANREGGGGSREWVSALSTECARSLGRRRLKRRGAGDGNGAETTEEREAKRAKLRFRRRKRQRYGYSAVRSWFILNEVTPRGT